MTWFAFQGYNKGNPIDLAGAQEKEAVSFGFHGYGTAAQAKAHPNSVNLLQKPFVNAIIADAAAATRTGTQPGGPNNIFNIPGNVANSVLDRWLKSLGGAIGSGIEAGLVSLLKDLWNVIVGPVEVVAGIALGIIILLWAFRDDIGSLKAVLR